MLNKPRLISSQIYRHKDVVSAHPLVWPRAAVTVDLLRALGWLDDDAYVESPKATPMRLRRFHASEYIDAAMDAEATQSVSPEVRERYGIGAGDNPFFPGVIARAATACGAAVKAVQLLADGGIVFSPGGGAHHAHPALAAGFCYFNDPALAICSMLDNGLNRICYIDIDAHHGDAVETAFAYNRNVLTISIHEAGCWPYTGTKSEPELGIINFPVSRGFNDSEMAFLLHEAILPLVQRHSPEAIVIQAGADSLADDFMMQLGLSNQAYADITNAMLGVAPRLLVLGGGGYNPWAVVRCWAVIWATLNGFEVPQRLPKTAESVLRNIPQDWDMMREQPEHWFTTLVDMNRTGNIRDSVRQAAAEIVSRQR